MTGNAPPVSREAQGPCRAGARTHHNPLAHSLAPGARGSGRGQLATRMGEPRSDVVGLKQPRTRATLPAAFEAPLLRISVDPTSPASEHTKAVSRSLSGPREQGGWRGTPPRSAPQARSKLGEHGTVSRGRQTPPSSFWKQRRIIVLRNIWRREATN